MAGGRPCAGLSPRPADRPSISRPRRTVRAAALVAALLAHGLAARLPAAFLRDVPIELRQPNGTVVTAYVTGDEYARTVHDAKGYSILRHPKTGWFTYATVRAGRIEASDYPVGSVDPALLGIPPGLRQEIERRVAALEAPPLIDQAPKTGTINNIVIFIRFSGESEFGVNISTYDAMFNSTAAGANSMRNYFTEASYGALTVSTTFYPAPVSSLVVSYQDTHERSYYQVYNAISNPNGYQGETQRRIREHGLLRDAVNSVNSQIPADLVVDGDGDGQVDNVCFVVRGSPDGWSDLLWPHKWSLYTYNVYINSKRVYTYNLQLQSVMYNGVLCHEMFHSVGAPDLYRYTDTTITPVGPWDLMANQTNPPQHMGAAMKARYGSWIAAVPEITASGTYVLNPLVSPSGQCYKIRSPGSAGEYFVLEYRRKTGLFESGVPASGLIVQRINTAENGNADGPPDEIYIYRPGGTLSVNGTLSQANYTSDAVRTAISDATSPSPFLSTGAAGGLDVSEVGTCGSTISFRVTLPAVTVTSPNGSESWVRLSTHNVTWVSAGPAFANVKLEYTLNDGASWTTIAASTPNDGSHPWTLPAAATTQARIRVTNVFGFPADQSDAVFTIAEPATPTVTTAAIASIAWTTASGGGNVTSDGGAAVTARGVCWNTAGSPTVADAKTTNGTGTGSFTSSLTGLSPGTDYYVRAYATNSTGTAYGGQVAFTTAAVTTPTVTTAAITSITRTTASGGGNVTSFGGAAVTARGVCWNTTGTPTISDAKTTNGTGAGAFTSSLTGLSAETTYYARAYATNSAGTAYGGQVSFMTLPPDSSPYQQILPEVIWAAATGGGTWVSEVQIMDRTGGSAVSAYFNSSAGRRGPFPVWTGAGAGGCVKFPNFLAVLQGLDGGFAYEGRVGAVQFLTQDADHEIRVSARTVNGDYGKTFQGRAPVEAELADALRPVMIQNLASNAVYRSAAGAFNPTAEPVTAEFTLHGPDGPIGMTFTREFAAYGFASFMVFEEAGLTYPGSSHDHAWLLVRPVGGAGALMCFGATANNRTNDPSAHAAVQVEPGFVSSPSSRLFLPEVIWAAATGGGTWLSEAQVTDLSGGSAVQVTFSSAAGVRGPFLLWTGPGAGRSVRFVNLLQAIDGLDTGGFVYQGAVGAVRFETQDADHRIHVSARTVNGDYGKTFQGLSDVPENCVSAGGRMMIPDVVSTEAYRSAAGFVNTGGGAAEVEFEILGESGRIGSPFTRTIPAGGFVSFMIFDAAGAPYPGESRDNAWLLIRPSSGTGAIMCFGATANNRTNDPSAHTALRY